MAYKIDSNMDFTLNLSINIINRRINSYKCAFILVEDKKQLLSILMMKNSIPIVFYTYIIFGCWCFIFYSIDIEELNCD